MKPEALREQKGRVDDLALLLVQERLELAQMLRQAQRDGASIAQLMEWTGYSRRQVFNLLAKA